MGKSAARYEMDMTTGPLLGKMIRFAIPLMFSSVLQLLYNAADMVVVGRFAGPNALAAVGATGAITALLVNLFMGLSVGANVDVAQHYGAGRYREVSDSVHTTVMLSTTGGIIIGILGILLARPLLTALDTPASVMDDAALYMKIYFAGMPFNLVYNFCAAILRAVGDTKRPLYYLALAGVINVALNLVFVIVLHMSVAGVALATIISQAVSMILVVICLIRTEGCINLSFRKLRFHRNNVAHIIRVGLPAGLQSSMFSISNTLIQSSINSFGAIAMAGNTTVSNIESFIHTPLSAFQQAAMSFTSQNYGAKKTERLGRIAMSASLLVSVTGIILGVLIVAFGRQLMGIYVSDDAVIAWGMNRMRVMTWLAFVGALGDVFSSCTRGTGNSMLPMFVSIMSICVFRIIWIYTAFAAMPTATVLYLSYPISWALAMVAHFACFMINMHKIKARISSQTP